MKKHLIVAVLNIMLLLNTYILSINCFEIIKYILFFNFLLHISYVDIFERIIPNKFVALILFLSLISLILECINNISFTVPIILSYIKGCLICGGILTATWIINKKSVGFGDIKLIFVTGLCLGFERTICCLILSLVLLSLNAIILILIKKINLKDSLPYAPYVSAAAMIVLSLGL